MGFQIETSVSLLTVFIQGLLSFFSPCVLPLLSVYIGYLSGGTMKRDENGELKYDRRKVMLNTLFFVIGISFAFFILGMGMSVLGQFFRDSHKILEKTGGVIIVLFGLYQLGVLGTSGIMSREKKISFRFEKFAMSPWVALVMGFTFSFAWTPCIGPVLASVLLMTASAASEAAGFGLIAMYTLGFVLPFLAVGLFTTSLLSLFHKYRNVVKYTVKIGGALLIVMGILIFTGRFGSVAGYLASVSDSGQQTVTEKVEETPTEAPEVSPTAIPEATPTDTPAAMPTDTPEAAPIDTPAVTPTVTVSPTNGAEKQTEKKLYPAIDFTLTDQNGKTHTLSDYKGRAVFVNFWATWCPPCKAEMPDIQKLYEEYGENEGEELVILGIAGPNYGEEKSVDGIREFLEENGYTYPVLMDESLKTFASYGINAYPTTFMIDKDGNIFGYITGGLTDEVMHRIVNQTLEGKK